MDIFKFKRIGFQVFILFSVMNYSCSGPTPSQNDQRREVNQNAVDFIKNISLYCGNSFDGQILGGKDRDHNINHPIAVKFISCSDQEVRIETEWDMGIKTTIIFTLVDNELLLKHDVRTGDLSPAEITMFGGFATLEGSSTFQTFPVHNFGREMWPDYENYSWEVQLNTPDYLLEYIEKNDEEITRHFVVSHKSNN